MYLRNINGGDYVKKLSRYKLNKISERLDAVFNMATQTDINKGLQWYINANREVCRFAEYYKVDPMIVAGVISALSPRNQWNRNIEDATTVLKAVKAGLHPNTVKVSTFNSNKFKAFAIASGDGRIDVKSRKTYAFSRNMATLDPRYVTVDMWHLRACFGKDITNMTESNYDDIQALTIRKATELGLKGYEYQAIIWITIQDNY